MFEGNAHDITDSPTREMIACGSREFAPCPGGWTGRWERKQRVARHIYERASGLVENRSTTPWIISYFDRS